MLFINAPQSGLAIPPPRLTHILTEAAAVDGTLGLIRPIVLNIVGSVLSRIAESPRAELPTRTLLANDEIAALIRGLPSTVIRYNK
jgi:hypothetical protein